MPLQIELSGFYLKGPSVNIIHKGKLLSTGRRNDVHVNVQRCIVGSGGLCSLECYILGL